MTTQTATTAFINALIVRLRASMATDAQATRAPTVHGRSRPMVDPMLIPAYRRRRVLRNPAAQLEAERSPGATSDEQLSANS